jgi:SAM-dependent methyltransferase
MADDWFELATLDHFWIRRRFKVLQRLAGSLLSSARDLAEVGCGQGLLQLQIERAYSRGVTGLDLNEFALQRNQSRLSPVCCYDVHQRRPEFKEHFDGILLFDVLEHIDDEDRFLESVRFHLAPGGSLIVNVPAGQWLSSPYDQAAGHKRRYSPASLRAVGGRNHLNITSWTYWGLPLIPTLVLRKLLLAGKRNRQNIIAKGFDPGSPSANRILSVVSSCEPIPQKLLGTSLMAVFQQRA